MNSDRANFSVGQLITHRLFEYRGGGVDPHFLGGEDWYQKMAHTRPPKDRPWYHVLVDGAEYQTYVAERNLEADDSGAPIRPPPPRPVFRRVGRRTLHAAAKGQLARATRSWTDKLDC